jgi:hypothetical protein
MIEALSRQELWTEVRQILPYIVGAAGGGIYTLLLVYLVRAVARREWKRELLKNYDESVRQQIGRRDRRIRELTAALERQQRRSTELLTRIRAGHLMAAKTIETLGVYQRDGKGRSAR